MDEDLLTSNFYEKMSSKSESCESEPRSLMFEESSPGKHDVSSISKGVSKIWGISLFVKNMLMSSSVFETWLCGSDYKLWCLVAILLSLNHTYLIVNQCAVKLVRNISYWAFKCEPFEDIQIEVQLAISNYLAGTYLGFSFICSISCLISSITALH